MSRNLHNPEIQNALVSKRSTLIVNRYKYTDSYAWWGLKTRHVKTIYWITSLRKTILVNILQIPVAIVSNIYQTANRPNEEQALALIGHEAELHNYSLEFWLFRILK